jgi:hypothetical protein
MKARTIASTQAWQSPDGQKTIWDVTLESDGKQYPLKTFSPKIAEVGFEGEVESYSNQRGDRFVKQPQKQGGYGGGQTKDGAAIKAQFAIKAAIQYAGLQGSMPAMEDIEGYAGMFFGMIDRIKGGQS